MSTIFSIILIAYSLIFGMNREKFVGYMVTAYEKQNGEIVVKSCPFVDSKEYPQVCKAYSVGITNGTSSTTFSPLARIEPYQAFLFIGKTMMLLSR